MRCPGQIALFVIKHHASTSSSWDCWDHHWDHSHGRQRGWSGHQANVSQHWNVGHTQHDDDLTWKHFPHYLSFGRGIHHKPRICGILEWNVYQIVKQSPLCLFGWEKIFIMKLVRKFQPNAVLKPKKFLCTRHVVRLGIVYTVDSLR